MERLPKIVVYFILLWYVISVINDKITSTVDKCSKKTSTIFNWKNYTTLPTLYQVITAALHIISIETRNVWLIAIFNNIFFKYLFYEKIKLIPVLVWIIVISVKCWIITYYKTKKCTCIFKSRTIVLPYLKFCIDWMEIIKTVHSNCNSSRSVGIIHTFISKDIFHKVSICVFSHTK